MNNFVKNIILLVVVLVLSYLTASYFGSLYNYVFPDSLGGGWIGSQQSWLFIIGFPLAYLFIVTTMFQLFGFRHRNRWLVILIIPPTLFLLYFDWAHIHLSILLGFIALGLATLIRKVLKIGE